MAMLDTFVVHILSYIIPLAQILVRRKVGWKVGWKVGRYARWDDVLFGRQCESYRASWSRGTGTAHVLLGGGAGGSTCSHAQHRAALYHQAVLDSPYLWSFSDFCNFVVIF
jgi:hypothetical protein